MTPSRAEALPRTLAGFRGLHHGETIVVCGCGASLTRLREPGRFLTVGVNDVGRLFDPTYLVVLNPRSQFRGDRFRHVEESRARAVFTQLDLRLPHPCVVRFRLGERGGTDLSDPSVLPYTRNSPYVALCLAAHLGARRIGLIGVDFTDHHFFAATGAHPLARHLERIDREYRRLGRALAERGVEVVNLSAESRLSAFAKGSLEELSEGAGAAPRPRAVPHRGEIMRIAIERHKPGIVGDFLDGLAETAGRLGHTVVRDVRRVRRDPRALSIVWNGRSHRSAGPTLYCEHAWLPRWEYQISPGGINADHHIAPFECDGEPLAEEELAALEGHLAEIRRGGPKGFQYMQTDAPALRDLPQEFLLVPLQMEWDTNIRRHVPARLRRMQALVDHVSAFDPPWPILFKQHPADVRRGNRQLRLRLPRRRDLVRPHDRGNVHQLLKSGRCRGVVSLNSNVVHDALLWDVPGVVLGSNVWPRSGRTPFLTAPPDEWSDLALQVSDPERVACRRAYAHYLMRHQWKLADARSADRVGELLAGLAPKAPGRATPRRLPAAPSGRPAGPRRARPTPAAPPSLGLNVAARDRGWFFEDLKRHFARVRRPGVRIHVTERPERHADAWIVIRTQEAADAPDPGRTLVQIHDLFDHGLYRPGGRRHALRGCAAVALTHPEQRRILEASGVDLAGKRILERPIGALEAFRLRDALPDRFTVAWVGRPVRHFGHELKRVDRFVEAVEALGGEVRVVLLGERLEAQHRRLRRAGVDCRYLHRSRNPVETYPGHYRGFDCVAITSRSEAGPLCLFEALASGVPVVSTRVGWAPQLIESGRNGLLVETAEELTGALERIRAERRLWFDRRAAIRASLGGHTLESWVEANVDAVLELLVRRSA